jgi:hypothetical protein
MGTCHFPLFQRRAPPGQRPFARVGGLGGGGCRGWVLHQAAGDHAVDRLHLSWTGGPPARPVPQLVLSVAARAGGWAYSVQPPAIFELFFGGGGLAQQGRAHSRRLHSAETAPPALMGRAAHSVEAKAVVRIEVAVRPRPCPCLGGRAALSVELAILRGHPPVPFGLPSPHHWTPHSDPVPVHTCIWAICRQWVNGQNINLRSGLYGGILTSHIDEQLPPRGFWLIRTPYTHTHTPTTTRHPHPPKKW